MHKKNKRIANIFEGFVDIMHSDYETYTELRKDEIYEAFVAGMGCFFSITAHHPERFTELSKDVVNAQRLILNLTDQD
jgi:hypothetical protein